jgi:hypothetical protein
MSEKFSDEGLSGGRRRILNRVLYVGHFKSSAHCTFSL